MLIARSSDSFGLVDTKIECVDSICESRVVGMANSIKRQKSQLRRRRKETQVGWRRWWMLPKNLKYLLGNAEAVFDISYNIMDFRTWRIPS